MKGRLFILTTILWLVSVCPAIFAQAQKGAQMTAADELFKARKWAEAANAYETILKNEPNNGDAWYRLATARYTLKQYAPAAEAFQKNIDLNGNTFAMYNLACVFSLMGEKEKAIEWLTKTVDNPKTILPTVNFNDPDFANIKDDARFKALSEKVDRKVQPCKYSAEAKQFDFWIGEWEVFTPQGRKDGTSVIQLIANGCGILENWRDNFGGEGKSINFYDAAAGKWFQYWIGSRGTPQRFSGIFKDGAIRYEGEPLTQNGKTILSRLTFFNIDADTVRQFYETSADNGKTWNVGYDYKYVRKTPKN